MTKSDLSEEGPGAPGAETRVDDIEEEKVKIVIFTLRDGLYGLFGSDVKEILPLMDISPVPGAPGFIPGVINNRGDIESVINLNRFLGLADSDLTQGSRIAIASKGGVRSGILLDSVVDVVDIALSSMEPPLSTFDSVKKELVAGEVMYRDESIVILDIGRVFGKLRADAE